MVGFWKTIDKANFRCYHYFTVPLPVVREVMDVEDTKLNQFLFLGNMHGPQEPGDLFFFYKQKNI